MAKGLVLVLGARSDIGMAVAKRFAAEGHPVALAARNAERLEAPAQTLRTQSSSSVTVLEYDALNVAGLPLFIDALPELPEVVVSAVGLMGDQATNEVDLNAAARVIRSNFEGPALALAAFANAFERRGSGTLVGISSVAGDRGRATNYVYGSAKAGFTTFLSGLRNRLTGKGIHVVTVKPGFVYTKMTEGMDLPAALTAKPEAVAEAIFAACKTGKNVVYVKPVWRLVMAIIRAIPEGVFKKLSL
ncbi:MAG TPA: short-chain dehydrogenase [Maritimibacter sp.]|nr:short-chain dehydrogenase [Maritimibacter sp.]